MSENQTIVTHTINPTPPDEPGKSSAGREALEYKRSNVSWGTSQFIARPSPMLVRLFIYGFMSLLGIAAAYSTFARVAVAVDAAGTITPIEQPFPIKAEVPIRVRRLHVQKNQFVKAGDLLLEAIDQISDEDYARLKQERESLLSVIEQTAEECSTCLTELELLAQKAFIYEGDGQVSQSLSEVRGLLLRLLNEFKGFREMDASSEGVRRRIATAQRKIAEIRSRKAEKMLAMQVEELRQEVTAGQSELAAQRSNIQKAVDDVKNQLRVKLEGLMSTIDKHRAQQVLRSPIEGVITELAVSGEEEFVSSGKPLITITPTAEGVEAVLKIQNQDIAEIREGMPVKLKLDAFPELRWGSVQGKVKKIPLNAESSENGQGESSYYAVQVSLDQQGFTQGDNDYPFRLGMTLQGSIIARYESLLMLGVRKIFRVKGDLLGG